MQKYPETVPFNGPGIWGLLKTSKPTIKNFRYTSPLNRSAQAMHGILNAVARLVFCLRKISCYKIL
jgi:hypothetical protein